jgi:hypothetical protein
VESTAPPPPVDVAPPLLWGSPEIVRDRLGAAVVDVTFEHDVCPLPTFGPAHYRAFVETSAGGAREALDRLDATAPEEAAALRGALEALAAEYFATC